MASLYRKWRPKQFNDVVGQSHVVDTIVYSLKNNLSGHAYLFTGPRGTGKTTVARLLAKSLNCMNPFPEGVACNTCEICNAIDLGNFLDIIEIDAASNRGIDEMRELRDKVRFKPTQGKKKIYIIDEVHMLTKEAFNALLKTLEEPPDHAVFILATTEPHKVPQTIISRTQRFDFHPANKTTLFTQLQKISEAENIKITKEALLFIASAADGSFRDALSILEQVQGVAAGAKIDQKALETLLGLPSHELIENIFIAWQTGSLEMIHQLLLQAQEQGINMEQLTRELLRFVNKLLIISSGAEMQNEQFYKIAKKTNVNDLLKLMSSLIEQLVNIKNSQLTHIPLALALLSTIAEPKRIDGLSNSEEELKTEKIITEPKKIKNTEESKISQNPQPNEQHTNNAVEVYEVADDEEFRSALLEAAKPLNHSIFATLKVANILRNGKSCVIEVHYPFHLEQLNKLSAKALLQDLVKKFNCDELEIKLNREIKTKKKDIAKDDELMEMAKEIFSE